jgi:ATP-dependent Clp protease ATP-binding subunit ClpB
MTQEGALDLEIEAHVKELLKSHLRPEMINRIDDTVIFRQLTEEDLAGIVEIQISNLRRRVAHREIEVEVTDRAMHALASEGYDPQFGARPLKRVIQNRIENPLATKILVGELLDGDHIRIDYEGEQFIFDSKRLKPSEGE